MSSISRHTWLNTSPGYLLHIKQHLSCTYLAWTKALCSQVQSSACRRPEHCKPPAAPISIPCLLNTISGTWELPCLPTLYISRCLWYSFNAEDTQRFFFLSLSLSLGNLCVRCCRNNPDPPKDSQAVKFHVKWEGGGRNDKSFLLKFSPQMDLAEPGSADLKARFIIRAGCCLKGEKIFEVVEWWKGLPPPLPHTHFLRVVTGRCSTALSQEITWQIKQLCVLVLSFYLNI